MLLQCVSCWPKFDQCVAVSSEIDEFNLCRSVIACHTFERAGRSPENKFPVAAREPPSTHSRNFGRNATALQVLSGHMARERNVRSQFNPERPASQGYCQVPCRTGIVPD